jgi:hypothetical protein
MIVANNKIDGNKNTCQTLAILMAMRIWLCNVGHIAQWSTSMASCPPDAAIGQVPMPYCLGSRHG